MFSKSGFLSIFITTLLLFGICSIPCAAAGIPQITWCRVEEADTFAVLHFETPSEYIDRIDGYEFRTQNLPWTEVADSLGTALTVPEGRTVYLRAFKDGVYGAELTVPIRFGKAYMLSDPLTDISAFYRASANFPEQAYMTAERIIGGDVYNSVQAAVQSSKTFALYDIRFLYAGATEFSPRDEVLLRFPLGESFKRNHCKVYYNDAEGKRLYLLDVTYDRTSAVVQSRGNGLYFIVDEWNGQSEIQPLPSADVGKNVSFYGFKLCIGDINSDTLIDPADARLALRAAVDLEKPGILQQECADIDRDGAITPADARRILRYSVGLQ